MPDFKYIIPSNKEGHYKRTIRPSLQAQIKAGTAEIKDEVERLLFGKPNQKVKCQ